MKDHHLRFVRNFRVLPGNRRAQAAEMTLRPRQSEGGPDNRHRGSDQWLYVVAGTGVAIVKKRRIALREGTLVLIERNERHEIKNTGRSQLKTLNIYVPPAYESDGTPRPAGRAN